MCEYLLIFVVYNLIVYSFPPSADSGPTAKKPAKASKDGTTPQQPATHKSSSSSGREQPNKILFLTSLPEETNEQMLTMLFQQWVV